MFKHPNIPNASTRESLELLNFEIFSKDKLQLLEIDKDGDYEYGVYSQSRKGEIVLKDGSIFKGSIVNDRAQGQGILTLKNGTICSGNFEGGVLKGRASINFSNGTKFTGNWLVDHPFGFGEITYSDSTIFQAFFDDKGRPIVHHWMSKYFHKTLPPGYYYKDSSNIKYFNVYHPSKKVRVETEDGLVYKGSISDKLLMNGKGTLLNRRTGSEITTVFKRNVALDQEITIWGQDGERISGRWRNKGRGIGKIEYPNGAVYTGSLKELEPHKKGRYNLQGELPKFINFSFHQPIRGENKVYSYKEECYMEGKFKKTKYLGVKYTYENFQVEQKKNKFIIAYNHDHLLHNSEFEGIHPILRLRCVTNNFHKFYVDNKTENNQEIIKEVSSDGRFWITKSDFHTNQFERVELFDNDGKYYMINVRISDYYYKGLIRKQMGIVNQSKIRNPITFSGKRLKVRNFSVYKVNKHEIEKVTANGSKEISYFNISKTKVQNADGVEEEKESVTLKKRVSFYSCGSLMEISFLDRNISIRWNNWLIMKMYKYTYVKNSCHYEFSVSCRNDYKPWTQVEGRSNRQGGFMGRIREFHSKVYNEGCCVKVDKYQYNFQKRQWFNGYRMEEDGAMCFQDNCLYKIKLRDLILGLDNKLEYKEHS